LIRLPVLLHCLEELITDIGQSRPQIRIRSIRRRYLEGTLILETEFETDNGSVTLVDFMTLRSESPLLGRRVSGIRGQVQMNLELVIRFDYGSVVPWVRRTGHGISAIAGPDMLALHTKDATPRREPQNCRNLYRRERAERSLRSGVVSLAQR
jgi:GH15 family glucan-1,4-alpha-glucosidase